MVTLCNPLLLKPEWRINVREFLPFLHCGVSHRKQASVHKILIKNGRMFSLPHFNFNHLNFWTKIFVHVCRLISWLSLGIYISWVECSVNKQISLNCMLFLLHSVSSTDLKFACLRKKSIKLISLKSQNVIPIIPENSFGLLRDNILCFNCLSCITVFRLQRGTSGRSTISWSRVQRKLY